MSLPTTGMLVVGLFALLVLDPDPDPPAAGGSVAAQVVMRSTWFGVAGTF